MEGNQIRFIESSDSGIKKLVASAVPERTKKSPKYVNVNVNVYVIGHSPSGLFRTNVN